MLLHQIKDIKGGRVITNDVVAKDKEEIKYKGYVLEWDETTPPVIKDPKGKIIFTYSSIKSLPTFTGFHAKVDSHLQNNDSKTVDEQISELKSKASQARSMGYATDIYDEEIEKRIDNNLSKDSKTKIPDNPFVKNQIAIAKKTLNTPSAILGILGGMTKEEAKKKGYGTDAYDAQIKSLQKDVVDGGPGSGQKGHKTYNPSDPATHQERRKERTNLEMYIKNAIKSGNREEAQKFSKRLAHINSLQLNDSADSSDILTQDPKTKDAGTSSFGTKSMTIEELKKKAKEGQFEYWSDPKPRRHIEIRYPNGKTEQVWVEDSKTRDASRSEQAYDEGYEAALMGKPSSVNPYTNVSRSGYADLKESWEDGFNDGQKEIAKRFRESKDSDIIINVIEKDNEESEEEAFDLIHYNGYNIKLVKETGEFDIYDVGGALIGHTATLELAKLFVDNKGNAIIG